MNYVGKDLWNCLSILLLKAGPIRSDYTGTWLIMFWDYTVSLDSVWPTSLMLGRTFSCLIRTLLAAACVCCLLSLCCAPTRVLLCVPFTQSWVSPQLRYLEVEQTHFSQLFFVYRVIILQLCWWPSFGLAPEYISLLRVDPKTRHCI